jgi:hypothetical protein
MMMMMMMIVVGGVDYYYSAVRYQYIESELIVSSKNKSVQDMNANTTDTTWYYSQFCTCTSNSCYQYWYKCA